MEAEQVQPGRKIRHTPTLGHYVILAYCQMRLPDGKWVRAARYERWPFVTSPGLEYVRPIADFGNFTVVTE